jgi:hypothetical protein
LVVKRSNGLLKRVTILQAIKDRTRGSPGEIGALGGWSSGPRRSFLVLRPIRPNDNRDTAARLRRCRPYIPI